MVYKVHGEIVSLYFHKILKILVRFSFIQEDLKAAGSNFLTNPITLSTNLSGALAMIKTLIFSSCRTTIASFNYKF